MTAPLRTSSAGLSLICRNEGLRTIAYRDGGGVPTIGYGHTRGVRMGQKCTKDQADAWLIEDVHIVEATIRAYVADRVIENMPQAAWDALADFVFNLGSQVFANPRTGERTTFVRTLESDFHAVPAQFRRWVYDNGKKIDGLVARRERCVALWLTAFREQPA
jgi:lysozyme